MVTRQVLLEAMCETLVIVSAQVEGLIKVLRHEKGAKNHACMTAKGIIYFYSGRLINITIENFGKVDVSLPKHQKFGEVANAP